MEAAVSQKEKDQILWKHYLTHRNPDAKAVLLSRYAYLVRYVISRMKVSLVPTVDRDDLESVGAIGLIKALERYDATKKVKFETYAYRRIQGSILDYLRHLDNLSRSSRDKINRFKRIFRLLREKLGRSPTDKELLRRLKINMRELKQIYFEMCSDNTIAIESFAGASTEDGEKGQDGVEDDHDRGALHELVQKELHHNLKKSIEHLPEKERRLISLYYYDDLTFKQIGEILQISESRVCQLHSRALIDIENSLKKAA